MAPVTVRTGSDMPTASRYQSTRWSGIGRDEFDRLRSPRGALLVGSPEQVVEKILFEHEVFGHDRFLAQTSLGSLPHDRALRSIELLGTEVAPAVRAELARRAA